MRASEFTNSKLVIFDIDDTLVNTDTKIGVVRDGRVVKRLNSHDFTHYKLQPGEEFDFGAFRDAREFFHNARPIAPMIRQLKNDIKTGNKVIMVTARADFDDRDVFLDTFRKYGVDMDRVHVYRAGNIQMKAATEEKKKMVLRLLLGKTHYDKVIMYDDAVPNLDAFLSLAQDYPWSKFYAWHVDQDGSATEYHRSGASIRESDSNKRSATGQQVLKYLLSIHPPEETTPFLKDLVLKWPRYELRTVPLSKLKIPPPYYPDDAEEEDERVDPYGRTLWVDYDHAGEVSQHNVDRYPIIIDPQGHIIDGNHRAWAAAELLNRDSIKAWVAVDNLKEIGDRPAAHEPNRRRKRSLFHATVDGHWVDVFFDRSDINGTLHITFTVNNNYEAPDQPTSASGSTIKILSTVLAIIKQRLPEYIKKARPPAVSFTAKEDNRAQLYRKYFVPVVQNILGPDWTLNEYPNMGMTVFNWRPSKKPEVKENFADGRVQGKSRPGRVKRAGASCKGSVTDLRARARKYGGERGRMYHWCANMKSGRNK